MPLGQVPCRAKPLRIVVVARHNDNRPPAARRQREHAVVEQLLGRRARGIHIEDVARGQHQVHVVPFGQLAQLAHDLLLFLQPVPALELLAQVPVGRM